MYECEGGGAVDIGWYRDVGTEMPDDPDNTGEHYGEAPLLHLGTTWTLGPPLTRPQFAAARAAAQQGFSAFDTYMNASPAASWYTGRVLSERDALYRAALKRE